jgi:hypothetical protein
LLKQRAEVLIHLVIAAAGLKLLQEVSGDRVRSKQGRHISVDELPIGNTFRASKS